MTERRRADPDAVGAQNLLPEKSAEDERGQRQGAADAPPALPVEAGAALDPQGRDAHHALASAGSAAAKMSSSNRKEAGQP